MVRPAYPCTFNVCRLVPSKEDRVTWIQATSASCRGVDEVVLNYPLSNVLSMQSYDQ